MTPEQIKQYRNDLETLLKFNQQIMPRGLAGMEIQGYVRAIKMALDLLDAITEKDAKGEYK